ncbi:MAG: hypothetical protein M0R80_22225 [Proteobacteria bacterium]|jgi:hypothetical protein|nr:hypothetical protein [Pseudomonadota bacterium]
MTFVTLQRAAAIAVSAAGLALCGCQDDITLPEVGGADVGECGAFYPGGGDPDAGIVYGAEPGDTLPCFVWTSVRLGAPDPDIEDPAEYANAYLSMPEIFLKSEDAAMSGFLEAQFQVSQARIILFAIASTSCGTCPDLMQAVVSSEGELFDHGIVPIGVLSFDLNDQTTTEAWDLITADAQLLDDGFDEALYRTNDPEHYLGDRSAFEAFPYIVAVRVSDMAVAVKGLGTDYVEYPGKTFKVDELVAAVEEFSAP